MAVENGAWIHAGTSLGRSLPHPQLAELVRWIDEIGFLPLFKNEIDGFSVEEHTSDLYWWSEDPEQDPWQWRQWIARSGQVAYGKFFREKGRIHLQGLVPPLVQLAAERI